jgi:hypothetical protein
MNIYGSEFRNFFISSLYLARYIHLTEEKNWVKCELQNIYIFSFYIVSVNQTKTDCNNESPSEKNVVTNVHDFPFFAYIFRLFDDPTLGKRSFFVCARDLLDV